MFVGIESESRSSPGLTFNAHRNWKLENDTYNVIHNIQIIVLDDFPFSIVCKNVICRSML